MSAGLAGLREVYTPAAAQALTARGEALRARLNAVAGAGPLPMRFTGLGSMMNVHMLPAGQGPVRSVRDLADQDAPLRDLFFFEMLEAGLWLARRGMINLSLAIGDAECERLVTAVQGFVQRHAALYAE